MSKLIVASSLVLRNWRLLMSAWIWLLLADWSLRVLRLEHVRAIFACSTRSVARPLAPVGRLAWLVGFAARHHLYPMGCLRRSFVLQRMLHKAGLQADLRIGVRKASGRLTAHAWVEHEGRPIGEAPGIDHLFLPLIRGNSAVCPTEERT